MTNGGRKWGGCEHREKLSSEIWQSRKTVKEMGKEMPALVLKLENGLGDRCK